MVTNINKPIQIYRDGQLDKWATHKQIIVPSIINGINTFDRSMTAVGDWLNDLPKTSHGFVAAINRELDRQAGR